MTTNGQYAPIQKEERGQKRAPNSMQTLLKPGPNEAFTSSFPPVKGVKLCSEVSTFLAAVGYRKGKGILSEDERHWQWAALFTMLFPVHTILSFFLLLAFN